MDLTPFLIGGATRPDSVSGFNPAFRSSITQLFGSAPPDIQASLRLSSGYRSPERQAQLYAEALKKYGSPEAARKWVAPPGRSNHNHGQAADLKYLSPAARQWAHANAPKFGLAFPLANEPWHIELASARGGKGAAPQSVAQVFAPTAGTGVTAPVPTPAANPQGMANVNPAAPVMPQGLASLFADGDAVPVMNMASQQRSQRQAEQQAMAEAERQRRLALLSSVGEAFA